MPPLAPDTLDDAQRRAADALIAGPRKAVFGPFIPLLRSPELLDRMQRVGEFLRFETSVPARLNEWAILVVARHWTNQFEWAVHHPLALKAGIARAAIDALAVGAEPPEMLEDESIVHAFASTLLETRRVPDALYAKALGLLGERGVVDLLGTIGYFSALDLLMNAVQTPAPASDVAPLAG
jgi:4-carboxymuconolactone decarboxylase